MVARGLTIPATAYVAAQDARAGYELAWDGFMAGYDLMLTPTVPVTAFLAGTDNPPMVAGRPVEYLSWTAFTYPFNATGQRPRFDRHDPFVPCGIDSGELEVQPSFPQRVPGGPRQRQPRLDMDQGRVVVTLNRVRRQEQVVALPAEDHVAGLLRDPLSFSGPGPKPPGNARPADARSPR